MAHPFEIEVIAADRRLYTGPTVSVVIPGAEGYFGVLRGHAPLLGALGVGELHITPPDGKAPLLLAVEGGFVEVTAQRVLVLADAAEMADEIDLERARMAKERAEGRLRTAAPDTDYERARAALMRSINRMRVAQRRGL